MGYEHTLMWHCLTALGELPGRVAPERIAQPDGFWAYFLTFLAGDDPFEWVRPIPNAAERSWQAFGPIFSLNRRFWIHFGQFLMFLARPENQVWAKA